MNFIIICRSHLLYYQAFNNNIRILITVLFLNNITCIGIVKYKDTEVQS